MVANAEQMKLQIQHTRSALTRDLSELIDRGHPKAVAYRKKRDARGKVTQLKTQLKESVMGSIEDARDGITGTVSEAGERAQSLAGSASQSASSAPGAARSRTAGHPLAAGLVAFGAGMLASALLPSSKAERQAAAAIQDKSQPLLERAKETGKQEAQQLREEVQPRLQQAVGEVQDSAKESVGRVQSEATSAGSDVQRDAASTAAEVRDSAKKRADEARS